MSQENVEIVRDSIAAINEGDYGRAMGHLADDVVLENPAGAFAAPFR
jgi:ketosteroid isomerase-like protein